MESLPPIKPSLLHYYTSLDAAQTNLAADLRESLRACGIITPSSFVRRRAEIKEILSEIILKYKAEREAYFGYGNDPTPSRADPVLPYIMPKANDKVQEMNKTKKRATKKIWKSFYKLYAALYPEQVLLTFAKCDRFLLVGTTLIALFTVFHRYRWRNYPAP